MPPLSTEAWQKYSGIIATHLSDQAWLDVRVAVEAVDNISRSRDLAFQAGLIATAVSDTTAAAVAPLLRDVKIGRGALAPFVRDASLNRQRDDT